MSDFVLYSAKTNVNTCYRSILFFKIAYCHCYTKCDPSLDWHADLVFIFKCNAIDCNTVVSKFIKTYSIFSLSINRTNDCSFYSILLYLMDLFENRFQKWLVIVMHVLPPSIALTNSTENSSVLTRESTVSVLAGQLCALTEINIKLTTVNVANKLISPFSTK